MSKLACAGKDLLQENALHRVSEARDVRDRAAPKVGSKGFRLQSRAHEHEAQVWPESQHVLQLQEATA